MARWHSCNVLMPGAQTRELWQFSAGSGKFALQRKVSKPPTEPLPEKVVAKDWQSLFQPRLNIAWLGADKVFGRVVQLPKADEEETRSMVELQLEKISPLPVAQIVWSFQVLPYIQQTGAGQNLNAYATGELQTVIVLMAARHVVEEYLGQLEGQGYLADRLELPLLDELRAARVKSNGAWVFPNLGGVEGTFMAAWWYEGVLQNLSIAHLPLTEARPALFQEQLAQASWAGEVEGWLTSEPVYHLVTDEATAAQWLPLFEGVQNVEVLPPLPLQDLAAQTARRVAGNGTSTNLLPPEFSTRYRQQFIDRLWMRGLGAVLMLYVLGVVVYFAFVQVAAWRYGNIQDKIASLGNEYTNTVALREKVRVLQDTLELQYAALECYKSAAETLPTEITLNSMNFERGRRVTFFGTVPFDDRAKVNDFNSKMLDHTVRGQKFYAKVNPPNSQVNQAIVSWNFSCDLKRTDTGE
jgi:hypothetical protein